MALGNVRRLSEAHWALPRLTSLPFSINPHASLSNPLFHSPTQPYITFSVLPTNNGLLPKGWKEGDIQDKTTEDSRLGWAVASRSGHSRLGSRRSQLGSWSGRSVGGVHQVGCDFCFCRKSQAVQRKRNPHLGRVGHGRTHLDYKESLRTWASRSWWFGGFEDCNCY